MPMMNYTATNFHATYTIKDSHRTLASGNLGEVANPFRQVQYLVLRAQRYSAYELVDLRLSAINLYAGQETQVEDFEEGDGTWDGKIHPCPALSVNLSALEEAAYANTEWYWTGPWPVLHAVVDWAPIQESLIRLHLYFDLLPPFIHISAEDSEFRIFTALSEQLNIPEEEEEGVYTAASQRAVEIVQGLWYNLAVGARLTMTILGWMAPGSPALMTAFYVASVIYVSSVVLTVIHTILLILENAISVLEGALTLFHFGWSTMLPWGLVGGGFSLINLWAVHRELVQFELTNGLVSESRLLQLNHKAGISLFSMYLTIIMGAYLVASALLIASAIGGS